MVRRLRRVTPVRARVLAGLVREHGWTRGAELGVFEGRTFLHLLRKCPDLDMTGVDLWRPQPEKGEKSPDGGRSYEAFDLDGMYADLTRKIALYEGRATLLRMATVEAAPLFKDGWFDFVFIDADHTYEGVRDDIRAWRPKIRDGGWILGHDWNERDFPGVVEAVRELLGEPETYPDHVWAVTV